MLQSTSIFRYSLMNDENDKKKLKTASIWSISSLKYSYLHVYWQPYAPFSQIIKIESAALISGFSKKICFFLQFYKKKINQWITRTLWNFIAALPKMNRMNCMWKPLFWNLKAQSYELFKNGSQKCIHTILWHVMFFQRLSNFYFSPNIK